MTRVRVQAVLILIVILGLALAGDDSGAATPPEPKPGGPPWVIAFSRTMPPALSEQAGTYYFDFPTSKDGVHYVYKRAPAVEPGQTITMVFALEGQGKLLANEGPSSARVRLFMQRKGDRLQESEPYKRWWSRAFSELVSPREFVLSARIAPTQWTSVFSAVGSKVPDEFRDCIDNLAHVGFTFGGSFFGHGVYVTNGAVRFVLKEFSIK
jgi:hypothetical protein